MKRFLSIMLVFAFAMSMFAGCSDGKNQNNTTLTEAFTDKGKSIAALFGNDYTYSIILDELSGINLDLKPDYGKYIEKEEKDDSSGTSVKKYYDGNILVYEVPEGYGERGFIYHTKTKNMKDVKASYWFEDEKIYTVDLAGDGFLVSYNSLDKNSHYGAKQINITVRKDTDGDVPSFISYDINGEGRVSVSSAAYWSDGVYKSYTCQLDESGKAEEEENVKFDVCKAKPDADVFRQISTDTVHSDVQTIVGKHKLSFKNDGQKKKWFITMDLFVIFDGEEAAIDYIADKSLYSKENVTYGNDYIEGGEYYVLYKDVTFAIDSRFIVNGEQNFVDFAVNEFDDYDFSKVVFSSQGDILGLELENNVMKYY